MNHPIINRLLIDYSLPIIPINQLWKSSDYTTLTAIYNWNIVACDVKHQYTHSLTVTAMKMSCLFCHDLAVHFIWKTCPLTLTLTSKFRELWCPARQQLWPWSRSKVKVTAWCQLKGLVTRIMHAKYQCSIINTLEDYESHQTTGHFWWNDESVW